VPLAGRIEIFAQAADEVAVAGRDVVGGVGLQFNDAGGLVDSGDRQDVVPPFVAGKNADLAGGRVGPAAAIGGRELTPSRFLYQCS
jgi:hypothetical protein